IDGQVLQPPGTRAVPVQVTEGGGLARRGVVGQPVLAREERLGAVRARRPVGTVAAAGGAALGVRGALRRGDRGRGAAGEQVDRRWWYGPRPEGAGAVRGDGVAGGPTGGPRPDDARDPWI